MEKTDTAAIVEELLLIGEYGTLDEKLAMDWKLVEACLRKDVRNLALAGF